MKPFIYIYFSHFFVNLRPLNANLKPLVVNFRPLNVNLGLLCANLKPLVVNFRLPSGDYRPFYHTQNKM